MAKDPKSSDEAADIFTEMLRMQGEAPALWRTLRRWTVALRASRSLAVLYSALFQRGQIE